MIEVIDCNGNNLVCTKDHILIDENGNECFAKDSFEKNIKTQSGTAKIVKVKESIFAKTYDLSLSDKSSHTFFANGFLSHNCVILDEFAFL